MKEPRVIAETAAFLVLYKPAGMHSAPLKANEEGTLLAWCADKFPETLLVRGRKAIEGGLVHRLDGETAGLVLVARTQAAFDQLHRQQEAGTLIKDYVARCTRLEITAGRLGFPPPPSWSGIPLVVESAFRPFGPGRRAVRPVSGGDEGRTPGFGDDRGLGYRTEVREWGEEKDLSLRLVVRLTRGFRHQIRCHLAWLGLPIIGDTLYGGEVRPGEGLALLAQSLYFRDPDSDVPYRFSVEG